MIEERRKTLQSFLQELTLIPAIKESFQFKKFLGINEQFPEFCGDSYVPNSSRGVNFKIIGDLFDSSVNKSKVVPNQATTEYDTIENEAPLYSLN